MFMDGCKRGEIESPTDFLQARRVAVVLDELVQVVEDFTLPFREREHFIPPVGRGSETIMRTEGEDQGRGRAIFARSLWRARLDIADCTKARQVLHSKSQLRRTS